MTRKIRLYVLGMLTALLAASCLDKYPTDGILADEAVSNVDQANQAVIGIYAAFKSSYLYSGNLTLLPDIQADLVYAINGNTNVYGDIWRWNLLATDTDIEAVYGTLYSVIGQCNYFFDQVGKWENGLTDDEAYEKLLRYKGEVYFARALAYSELIKCFCKAYESDDAARNELGVVLTSSVENPGEMKRASLYDSYAFVLNDLKEAGELLDPEDDGDDAVYYNTSYFTWYTVEALWARVCLYMKDYDGAIEHASNVIDSGNFLLSDVNTIYTNNLSYYDYMWLYDQSTEAIWKVGFTSTSYGGRLGTVFLNYVSGTYKPDFVPGSASLALYTETDMRYSSFFTQLTTSHTHGLTWPLLTKYIGNQNFWQDYNLYMLTMPKVFRLSEQYLIRAEAYCWKGNTGAAADDLTTLRKARFSSYGTATLPTDQEGWLDEISDERVRELYMEGFRLNDLKRWHRGFEREPQAQSLTEGSSLKVEADDPRFVWPIPQHELDAPGSQVEPNESNR